MEPSLTNGSLRPSISDASASVAREVNRFARILRHSGFKLSGGEVKGGIKALEAVDILIRHDVRAVLRCVFATSSAEWVKFDQLFDAFWLGQISSKTKVKSIGVYGGAEPAEILSDDKKSRRPNPLADYVQNLESHQGASDDIGRELSNLQGASDAPDNQKIDLNQVSDPLQLEEIHNLAAQLARRIKLKLIRRRRAHKSGRFIDIRRTQARSVATGGIPFKLFRQSPPKKPFKLLMFLDVSGSMDNYSRFFMRFMHGLSSEFRDTEAFIFHTKLVRISSLLKDRDPMRVMDRMSLVANGWSGGTKIAESFAEFDRHYAKSVMSGRTLIMIVSDGYDTDGADQLFIEMRKLRRRAKRIVWLNPLLGRQNYRPVSQAMSRVLPLIDLFASAHNIESLAALEPEFARI